MSSSDSTIVKEVKENTERQRLRDKEMVKLSASEVRSESQAAKKRRVSPRFSSPPQQTQNQENGGSEGEGTSLFGSIRSLMARRSIGSSPMQQRESPMSAVRRNNGSISVTMESEVLDCPICLETFSIPVYQCENGHTACSSCCNKLAHKCPSCSSPVGYIRCRAIEKVLESAKISCQNMKYGCKDIVSYIKKCDHEKTCIYAPCFCPVSGCSFVSSSEQLYSHLSSKHEGDTKRFEYNCTISVSFTASEKFVVLQEEKEGVVFILNNALQIMGNVIMVSCIGPSSNGGYFYELSANSEGNSLIFRSFTPCIQCRVDNPPSVNFLLVPGGYFGSGEQITLDLCICRKDAQSANTQSSNC